MAAVLVDVDGTLLSGPTSEALFIRHLLRRGRLGPRQLAAAALFAVRWAPRYGRHVFKKDKAYLVGLAIAEVAELADAFVAEALAPRIRPSVTERIAAHLAAGDRVALLTGTLDEIARPLAALAGAEAWSATPAISRDGTFTSDPPDIHPFGEEKVSEARALCERLGCKLEEAVAYANSGHDLPLLRRVARPVAVCPDAALARAARREGWEVIPG